MGWKFIYSRFFMELHSKKNILEYSAHWILYNCMQELWVYWIRINILKIKIYKRVLKDVSEKYKEAEEFIKLVSGRGNLFFMFSC